VPHLGFVRVTVSLVRHGKWVVDDVSCRGHQQVREAHGKDATPFLLGRIVEIIGGESLRAIIALVRNNAYLSAQVAQEHAAFSHA
jgi:pseudouridine-5'-phosphate glycosidase